MLGDVKYLYSSFEFTKEEKIIGRFDGYTIREFPEDPDHNFLVVRSFLDQDYLVREDYNIPEGGEVSRCYVNGERCVKKKVLKALEGILSYEFEDRYPVEFDKCPDGLEWVYVEY